MKRKNPKKKKLCCTKSSACLYLNRNGLVINSIKANMLYLRHVVFTCVYQLWNTKRLHLILIINKPSKTIKRITQKRGIEGLIQVL